MQPVEGIVVKIPNEYTIIVNIGSSKISVNDKIVIYEKASEVIDPFKHESLGYFSFNKAILKVTETTEKFSVCKHIEQQPGLFDVSPLIKNSSIALALNVDESQNEKIYSKDSVIRIGDPVRKLSE